MSSIDVVAACAGDAMAMAQALALRSTQQQRESARVERDAARQAREAAFSDRIESMQDAALIALVTGLAQGGLQAASGAITVGAGASGGAAAGSAGEAAAAQAAASRAAAHAGALDQFSQLVGVLGNAAGRSAEIDAEQSNHEVQVAQEQSAEASEQMSEIRERAGRVLQRLDAIAQAEQQAMLTAIGRGA